MIWSLLFSLQGAFAQAYLDEAVPSQMLAEIFENGQVPGLLLKLHRQFSSKDSRVLEANGDKIRAGVLDQGVDLLHPFLKDR
ncbi:MAG: hypothetical protein WCH11_06230, partial [Bdellovibrio sp.]